MPNSSNGVFQVRQESSQREGGAEIKCADQNALQCCARYSALCLLPRLPSSVTIGCGGMGVTSGKGLAVGVCWKMRSRSFHMGKELPSMYLAPPSAVGSPSVALHHPAQRIVLFSAGFPGQPWASSIPAASGFQKTHPLLHGTCFGHWFHLSHWGWNGLKNVMSLLLFVEI